ncbi:hypothetical protein COCON_G00044400 [Conger conger]|uniref:Sodium/potassium-transporting ATPase subunit beta n=1 Tax=Conger conger TaxID=82655 RepID=A0A9Q1DUD6_CONCO|nr:sodium/potassium-transporting ATPase subunit beta-2-like [Conger conger]KAJ8281921.1 hypothetical protein COCON_G00044400 [Conger conger]
MAKDSEKKTCGQVMDEWKEFFWNPRTHEFLGRTASSWGLILLFYLIFYICLAGMFALTMYVMLLTLDDYNPTYRDRLATPGMMIQPKGKALEIVYNIEDTESWDMYVHSLNTFLSTYNDSHQALSNKECTPNELFTQADSGDIKNNPKRSCQFNRTILEACSGLTDPYYGYDVGKPCVLVKLNRVIGMLPGKNNQSPNVTCKVKKDNENAVRELSFYPPDAAFNIMYFPYYGKKSQVNYSQPLVAVKFQNISVNTDVSVECKINSEAIANPTSERDKFAGRVSFKLRINQKV